MRTFTLVVPVARPLNANKRIHWATRAALTKELRSSARLHASGAKLPTLEHAHILAVLRFRRGAARRDANNWSPTVKAHVDGFVDAGLLVDDDSTRLAGPDLRIGALQVNPGPLAPALQIHYLISETLQEETR